MHVGTGDTWEISVPPSRFCCKMTLKTQSLKKTLMLYFHGILKYQKTFSDLLDYDFFFYFVIVNLGLVLASTSILFYTCFALALLFALQTAICSHGVE